MEFEYDETDKRLMRGLEEGIRIGGNKALEAFVDMSVESFIGGLHEQLTELADDIFQTKNFENGSTDFGTLLHTCHYEFSKLMMMAEKLAQKYDCIMPKHEHVVKAIDKVIMNDIRIAQAGLIFKISFVSVVNEFLEDYGEKLETDSKFDDIIKNFYSNNEEEE